MDETVVREIANQLGIAVDQAGQFIETYLPQYAQMKVFNDQVLLGTYFFFLVVLVIALVLVIKGYKRADDYDTEETLLFAGIALGKR